MCVFFSNQLGTEFRPVFVAGLLATISGQNIAIDLTTGVPFLDDFKGKSNGSPTFTRSKVSTHFWTPICF